MKWASSKGFLSFALRTGWAAQLSSGEIRKDSSASKWAIWDVWASDVFWMTHRGDFTDKFHWEKGSWQTQEFLAWLYLLADSVMAYCCRGCGWEEKGLGIAGPGYAPLFPDRDILRVSLIGNWVGVKGDQSFKRLFAELLIQWATLVFCGQ